MCEKLMPGQETLVWVKEKGRRGVPHLLEYAYMAPDWQVYQTVAPNLTSARLRRNAWMRKIGLTDICLVPGCMTPAPPDALCFYHQGMEDDADDQAMAERSMREGN